MLVIVVWIAVAVFAVVVLGAVLYTVLGAGRRLRRELAAVDRDVRPVLEQVQDSRARAAELAERRADDRRRPPSPARRTGAGSPPA